MATANVQLDPFSQEQQFPEQQQTFIWQQQPISQLLQQQLDQCRQFLVQQCSPVAMVPFLRSRMLQQSSCQVMRQLVQIPEQLRCPAIHSIVQAIIMQNQQQQQFFQPPQQQQGFFQPLTQQVSQGWFQPQQQVQIEGMRVFRCRPCQRCVMCTSHHTAPWPPSR